MSDLIRRYDVIEALTKIPGVGRRAIDAIYALPSAEAEWIPCSERLPKYSGTLCIVTIEGEDGARASLSYWQGNTHKWSDLGHYYKVIAWMPLPTPYKGGDSE